MLQFLTEIRATNGLILFQRSKVLLYLFLLFAYVVSPFDLIPEFIFGIFGIIDDLIVFLYMFIAISTVVYEYMVDRNREAVRAR